MIEKTIVDQIFRTLSGGQLKITYWDGTTQTYGKEGKLVGHLTFKDPSVIRNMLEDVELGFGEAYVKGDIEFEGKLTDLVYITNTNRQLFSESRQGKILGSLIRGIGKPTTVKEQKEDIHHHYDLGNDFFGLFLDPSMTYSCAYFRSPKDSLAKAQEQKVDHVLKKLRLKKGERLLDIGSGWGELITRGATKYGVTAHGITMSEEQEVKTNERIAKEKLDKQVSVALTDYREYAKEKGAVGAYDKIASVGMFEHVGRPNLPIFMDALAALLKPKGLALLHTITHPTETATGSWTMKYIFPGGYVPSLRETIALMPERGFSILDVENLRPHYALTLDHWAANFEKNLPKVREIFAHQERFGKRWGKPVDTEQFIRMWRLYLEGAAAGFRSGTVEIHQILVSKGVNDDVPLTREDLYR